MSYAKPERREGVLSKLDPRLRAKRFLPVASCRAPRLATGCRAAVGFEDGSGFAFNYPVDRSAEPRKPPRILLVDDLAIIRDMARAMLTRAGFAVDVAADGDEGFRLVAAHRYALILMDVHMPKIDGVSATCMIRGIDAPRGGGPDRRHDGGARAGPRPGPVGGRDARPSLETVQARRIARRDRPLDRLESRGRVAGGLGPMATYYMSGSRQSARRARGTAASARTGLPGATRCRRTWTFRKAGCVNKFGGDCV